MGQAGTAGVRAGGGLQGPQNEGGNLLRSFGNPIAEILNERSTSEGHPLASPSATGFGPSSESSGGRGPVRPLPLPGSTVPHPLRLDPDPGRLGGQGPPGGEPDLRAA